MKYSVGDLTIDTGTQVVSRAGETIALPKLSYELLLVLVRAAPNLVSLDELMRRVWPGIVVSPETVSQRIKLLRDALGDDPREPRYIAGLRGRGYQMVAVVTQHEAEPAVSASTAIEPPDLGVKSPTPRPESRRNRLLFFVVFVGFLLALGWILADKFRIPKPIAQGKATTAAPALAPISEKSIAVLPFVDMSEHKDQEYFSDGLSEELIDMLTKIPDLRVPARTSSFYFKGKQATISDIAKALAVAHVLEGSVRKSGNTLRVTAQLIRVDNGYHVWSDTYDRKLEDIFKVQDEIANAVVAALKVNLLPLQQPSAQEELRTANLSAYDLYLQGRQSYNQGNIAGHKNAVAAFRAAIALDPRYAAAYADLAVAQFWVTDDSTTGDLAADDEGFDRALAAAEKAVALAPGLAAGYSARGFLRLATRFDFAGAQADLDKALALSPSDANILHRSAILLAVFGKLPAAIAREEQALALDPLSAEICMRLAFFLVANQQLAQARQLYEKALVIAPQYDRALFNLGELELLENQPERALVLFRRTALEPFRLEGEAKTEYSLGHVDVSEQLLEQYIAKYGKDGPNFVARIYAWRGEKDQAFEWLERAYEVRDDGLPWLKFDPGIRNLRGDPRYKALLRKMNLPDG
jgi:TolB-like protein/DNA-binding winged helix-turn-helix (wHTH) protein/Flp pilus assembly protein TadD